MATTTRTETSSRKGCEPFCQAHVHCLACNSRQLRAHERSIQLQVCRRCGALQGTCLRGEAYSLVALHLPMAEAAAEALRYFDMTLLGSADIERVHGWYNPATKRVAQIG